MSSSSLLDVMQRLKTKVRPLAFEPPVAFVYNPLEYAWPVARQYVERYGRGPKDVVLLGMNPGPFGMAQTGVPFGQIEAVRDYLKLGGAIGAPPRMHPKKPVLGFDCPRSEVSGKRLWSAVAKRHLAADAFFARAFVLNYCPLLFLDAGGANLTPDKLAAADRARLEAICDRSLGEALDALAPKHVIGIGQYAAKRAAKVTGRTVITIPHPSPASPLANRGWEGAAQEALATAGIAGIL